MNSFSFIHTADLHLDSVFSGLRQVEGDMASLVLRTADHLRQATNLKVSHPELVSVAHAAIERILREPVLST